MSAIKQLAFFLHSMKLEKAIKIIRTIFYLTCLILFLVWLANAIENYLAKPTTTNVKLKYGDDNKKNATFPSITICKSPMNVGQESKLWNQIAPCDNNTLQLSSPKFLSYLEVCLESGSNLTVPELVKKVTYNMSEIFGNVQTSPAGSTILTSRSQFIEAIDKIVTSRYHFHYGNCFTVNISSLSKNDGMFPMEIDSQKFALLVNFYRVEHKAKINQFFFVHEGTDINLLGREIAASQFYGGQYYVIHQSFR